MSLTIALPTRDRPSLLLFTLKETLPHITEDDTRIVVLIDEDDAATRRAADYASKAPLNWPNLDKVIFSVGPREDSFGGKINRALNVRPADVYMFMVDYRPCLTPGFDAKVIEAAEVYPDGYAYVHFNLANLSFPEYQAVTHKLALEMGGMFPEYFPYWFIDHWLDDMGKMIGRVSYVDIKTDGSNRPNKTHELREPGYWGTVFDTLYPERAETAVRIIEKLDEPDWRKAALVRNFEIYRQRSEIINNIVREENDAIEKSRNSQEPDDRYKRIKAAADKRLSEIRVQFKAA